MLPLSFVYILQARTVPLPSLCFLQFTALREFLSRGGRLMVLLGEGGERRFQTNINFLLEEHGIVVNSGTSRVVPALIVYDSF